MRLLVSADRFSGNQDKRVTEIVVNSKERSKIELEKKFAILRLKVNESSPIGFLVGNADAFVVDGIRPNNIKLR